MLSDCMFLLSVCQIRQHVYLRHFHKPDIKKDIYTVISVTKRILSERLIKRNKQSCSTLGPSGKEKEKCKLGQCVIGT